MNEPGLLSDKIHQAYERLMAAILGISVQDPNIPIFYPYIIKERKRVFLEEGLKMVLETLPDFPSWSKERQIRLLILNFGLEDGKSRSLEEVGVGKEEEFDITKAGISQIRIRTLRILRHPSRSRFLIRFLIPTPKEEANNFQRLKELEEKRERLETTTRELEDEISQIEKENQRLTTFFKKWGIFLESFEIYQARDQLREALQEAASRYPRIGSNIVIRSYNGLVRNGINSLSQLKIIMNLDEGEIASIRNIGEKSFWLIKKTLEIIGEKDDE